MVSNMFNFENGCYNARAIITSVGYDELRDMYELALLGVGSDGCSFTNPGKAWMDKEDLAELMKPKNLERPQQLCGMQMMVVVDEEEFAKNGVPELNISKKMGKKSDLLSEILSDGQELVISDD